MPYIQGEGRSQGTLFPVTLDDRVPVDHMCRVIDAFVGQLNMDQLGFERSEPADTGRPDIQFCTGCARNVVIRRASG